MFSKLFAMVSMGLFSWGTALGALIGTIVCLLFLPTWTILLLGPVGALAGAFTHEWTEIYGTRARRR